MHGGVVGDEGLEFAEAGVDEAGRREMRGDGFGGLEAVAGDAEHGRFVRGNFAAGDELLRAGHGDAAGGFGEDAFGLGEQPDAFDDFLVGRVLAAAAAWP